jgi:uncharacterized membrane protein YqjE
MVDTNNHSPGFFSLLRKLGRTGLGALRNRGELLSVEWREENARLSEIMVWAIVLGFLAIAGLSLATVTIILLFPVEYRIYAFAGFSVLYIVGALVAWLNVKALLKHEPFAESLTQLKKDSVWLESLK